MAAYLIVFGANPSDRLAAYSFDTRRAALTASTSQLVPGVGEHAHAGGQAYVVETTADLPLGGKTLVEVYNGLTGSNVARFADRMSGIKRLLADLPNVAQVGPQPEEKKTVTEEAEKTTAARGRASKYKDDDVITVLAESNPRREGSKGNARFALYRNGMTVANFRAAGGDVNGINYDVTKGWIKVSAP